MCVCVMMYLWCVIVQYCRSQSAVWLPRNYWIATDVLNLWCSNHNNMKSKNKLWLHPATNRLCCSWDGRSRPCQWTWTGRLSGQSTRSCSRPTSSQWGSRAWQTARDCPWLSRTWAAVRSTLKPLLTTLMAGRWCGHVVMWWFWWLNKCNFLSLLCSHMIVIIQILTFTLPG